MRSLTVPLEAALHLSASSFRSSCQVEPLGASVPSFTWTCCWARAGAAAISAATRTIFFTLGVSSSSGEQVVHVVEQGAGPPLGEDVGESVGGRRVGVEGQHLLQHALELGPILLADEDGLRVADLHAQLLAPG